MDTIFAPATAAGKAGLSVVRLSGPLAREAVGRMAGRLPPGGRTLRWLKGPGGEVIDQALVLVFAAGASFTGDEVVELHLHGSPAVVRAVLSVLGEMPGLRMAEAGEFSRRALECGRLDLPQVEGLADLIDAETEAQRRQALRVLQGDLGRMAEGWRAVLIESLALIEVTIDFSDEEVPLEVGSDVAGRLRRVAAEMMREAGGARVAERVRAGFEVAIVGPANAGKSTLFNRLAGRTAALTSSRPGTTRDVIEVRLELEGLPVAVLDTAGLREASDDLEAAGIALGRERAASADLRVHLVDAGGVSGMDVRPGDIVVRGKADLTDGNGVSGLTGAGVEALIQRIGAELAGRVAGVGGAVRERHAEKMREAAGHLSEAAALLGEGAGIELAAEEVRLAVRAVDSLVGRVDVDDILEEIFGRFCIGK